MTDVTRALGSLDLPELPLGPLDSRAVARQADTSRPWTREQLATLCLVDAVALTLIAVGAFEANNQTGTKTALAWMGVSILGLTLAGTAQATWLLRVRRVLSLGIRIVTDARRMPLPVLDSANSREHSHEHVVVVDGSTRYHLAYCALADGRSTKQLAPDEVLGSQLTPCEVCNP